MKEYIKALSHSLTISTIWTCVSVVGNEKFVELSKNGDLLTYMALFFGIMVVRTLLIMIVLKEIKEYLNEK